MLYFLQKLSDCFGPLRLFGYVTFRAGGALMTSALITFLLGPYTIRLLNRFKTQAPSRLKGLVPEEHIDPEKDTVPSMGGLLIVFSITFSNILWALPGNPLVHIFLFTLLSLAAIGFADDYVKIARRNRNGIPAYVKLGLQLLVGLFAVLALDGLPETEKLLRQIILPFFKNPILPALPPVVAFAFSILVVTGSSNAVNLTDGKDGLAVGCVIFCALTYAVFAYMTGHSVFADYLKIPFIPGTSEVVVFASAIVGTCIGFLWFNCHPASMFMGDTGSLALGGTIGLMAVLVKQELTLIIVGGVFVLEALSVIIQVTSYKLTGKRIFLCTPIHHHFEQKGWTETQIVVRFWILAGLFALFGIATLKLR